MLLPSGFSDVEGTIGCFEAQAGVLECIDLASGSILARSEHPLSPVLVDTGQVLAWSSVDDPPHAVLVHLLEVSDGFLETIWHTHVELPDWVRSAEEEGHRFSLDGRREKDGLDGSHESFQDGGLPLRPWGSDAAAGKRGF